MHESSLVRSLLRQVDQVSDDNGGGSVSEIVIQLGPLSGVESALLQSAFEILAPQTRSANASLRIDKIPLLAKCLDCDQETQIDDFVFRCNHCQSGRVQVIDGDCVRLQSVSIHQPLGR